MHQASLILAGFTLHRTSEKVPAERRQGGSRIGDIIADRLERESTQNAKEQDRSGGAFMKRQGFLNSRK